ncbi:MAG: hypothetical protein RLZZ628_2331 [Bacteroidota bacterium]|jgi:hypothetical protein
MQYLVPLNNDEPFKKVFGDKWISKAFLEDMLGVEITEIELLSTDFKITSASSVVRFDFRCRINEQYVIIEMQQDYHDYLIQRFYLYHCLSTGLQLEIIKDKVAFNNAGKEVVIKRYTELKPVISIIWMSETNFGFKEDFVEFNTYPKMVADFINDDTVWSQDKPAILTLRNQLRTYLNSTEYHLDFHTQNRLIYVFQNNVVKNKQNKPYVKWFEFAQKTRHKKNQATDFQPYVNNLIFSEMIKRLSTQWMEPDELRAMMGNEAYEAAKKLTEQDREQDRLDKIYDQFYQAFGDQVREEKAAALWKLTMAYQDFGEKERAFLADKAKKEQEIAKKEQELAKVEQEKAQLEQAKLKAEQEKAQLRQAKVKAEQEKAKAEKEIAKMEQEKAKKEQEILKEKAEKKAEHAAMKRLLKAEQEKAKKEKETLLKAEQEKAKKEKEILLKAEQEKAKKEKEILLKAEQEKELLVRIKLVQKMFNKGNSVETIADLLDESVLQVQAWIQKMV